MHVGRLPRINGRKAEHLSVTTAPPFADPAIHGHIICKTQAQVCTTAFINVCHSTGRQARPPDGRTSECHGLVMAILLTRPTAMSCLDTS